MNLHHISIEQVGYVLLGAFILALLVQLWYYLGMFSALAFYRKKEKEPAVPPISVIICAKNEDDNLPFFLPLVLEQDYPDYEVVVVNDCSYDNTGELLEEYARRYKHLKIVTIKEDEHYSHGKKFALMVGIKGASHEHLLLTDADCKPASAQWIRQMVSEYTQETEIILGYGAYEKAPGFLNRIIRFDTFMIALQYFSFALRGKTYMGVGRNLSYKKSLFFKMKGFASHYHIESGDDDLFINEAATKRNSKIEIAIESHTLSRPKTTFKNWLYQKRRHLTTGKHYNMGSKLRLGLLSLSQYLFYLSFIALLILQVQPLPIISLFVFRLLIQMIIFKKCMDKLNEGDLWLLSFAMELVMMVVYPVIYISNLFVKKHTWR